MSDGKTLTSKGDFLAWLLKHKRRLERNLRKPLKEVLYDK